MRRLFPFLAFAMLITLSIEANTRTETEAQAIAAQYFARHSSTAAQFTLMPQATARRLQLAGKNKLPKKLSTPYYIYNKEGGGFVIVSGSDCLPPVIAHSDHGTIAASAAALPDGLRYWLGFVADAAEYVEQHPEAALTAADLASDYRKDYAPLLGVISFNQNSPYNDQCPEDTYTGCMATAMAQVMAYHKYPNHGEGYVSVNYNGRSYGVNLADYTYDWSKILPTYKGWQGTADERAEVAKLHYHVGLSLHMEYGEEASGSVSTMYTTALRDRFGYNRNTILINRDGYTYGEWIDILLGEFEAKRPVIYDGVCNDGGHAFVIDGYRASDGFFHVNWGWEGMSDGYYDITLLNPQQTGIGATLSSGFTTYQDAVINITPDADAPTKYYLPVQPFGGQGNITTTTGTVELGQQARLSFENICNMTDKSFSAEYGALILNLQGEEVARIPAGTASAGASTMSSNKHVDAYGGYWTVPADLRDGDYTVYIYMKESSRDDYAVLRTAINTPNFVRLSVKDGTATFTLDEHTPTGLKASDWSFQLGDIAYGTEGISCTMTNEGSEVEHGSLRIQVDVPNQLSRNYQIAPVRLLPGESRKVEFPILCNEYGDYRIRSMELARHNSSGLASIVPPGSLTFSVQRTAEETVRQLNSRLDKVQGILNNSRASGNYPDEACSTLQAVIDDTRRTPTDGLSADAVKALIDQLNAALLAFYKSLNTSEAETTYWSYIGTNRANTSWCPGGTSPVYFGISIPAHELAPYIGGQITGLRCLFGQNRWYTFTGDDLRLRIFLFDYDGSYPGDRILASSDEFSPENYAVYDNYLFSEPYTIDGSGLFCVVEMTAKYASYFGAMGASKETIMPGACWLNNGNGWEDLYYTYGSEASGLAIQTIIVGGTSVIDAKLSGIKSTPVAIGEDITLTGKLQNISAAPIEEYELSWSHDGEGLSSTKSFTQHIEVGSSVDFSLTIPGFETAKLHNVRLSVTKVNGQPDAIADNSTVDVPVAVTARKYARNVVLEEVTGTWCGFCPRGFAAIDYMKENYGTQFIPISIHTDDPMAFPNQRYAPLLVGLSTAPSGLINRNSSLYTSMDLAVVERFYKQEQASCIADISCTATYDASSDEVTVVTSTEFGYDFTQADYRIAYVVLEDNVGPYAQQNFYAGGSQGYMYGWESKAATVRMTYDDVARDLLPAYTGLEGSVPSTVAGGETYAHSHTFQLPLNVDNPDNVRIVALLLNPTTAEIINACQSNLVHSDITSLPSPLTVPNQPSTSYDLQGRTVKDGYRGIYLKQGRKVIPTNR